MTYASRVTEIQLSPQGGIDGAPSERSNELPTRTERCKFAHPYPLHTTTKTAPQSPGLSAAAHPHIRCALTAGSPLLGTA